MDICHLQFDDYIAEEISKYDGVAMPIKSNILTRLLVQRNLSTILPQKMPSHYRISLHVDDESIVCSMGRQYGYHAYHLDDEDDDWKEKIIEQAERVKKMIQ